MPLTDVASMLLDGKVENINVDGNRLEIAKADGSEVASVKEEGSVIEQLRNLGVSEEALNSADITIHDAAIGNMLWTITISLGPILLLIWIFSRSFKRIEIFSNKNSNAGHNKAGKQMYIDRLRELKASYEEELITQQEYETKRGEILSEL